MPLIFFQVDHPMAMPPSVSGHAASIFPLGPGFQPMGPMVGTAFGVGAGVTAHPTTFPGDAFGSAERPKKVSMTILCWGVVLYNTRLVGDN